MANELNFSRRPFANERLPRFVFALVAAAVLGLTLTHGYFLSRYLMREQEELDTKVSALRDELEATTRSIATSESAVAREQTVLGNERTTFILRLYRRKGFSWTGLFNELETITPGPVRITSIAPADEDERIAVTLNVVGRTLQDVLEMVRQLESSSFFATVFPLEESNLDELGRGATGIAATLRLQYVEPEPEATKSDDAVPTDEVSPPAGEDASLEEPSEPDTAPDMDDASMEEPPMEEEPPR